MQTPILFISPSSNSPPPPGKTEVPPMPDPSVATPVKKAPGPDKKPAPVKATKPKLPHERDEAVGEAPAVPSEQGRQAHRDLARGLQDTDRGPPSDRAYQKQK